MSRARAWSHRRARRFFALGTVLTGMLLAALPHALALDPESRISQYAHSAWRVRDGAFAGVPSAITQTTDGYVWVGTFAGLLRFDGVRFVPFAPPSGQHLPNPAVISLLGAKDGSLWIGTASGLTQWKNSELFTFPEITGRVNSIYEDSDGTIWIARSRTDAGGVCKVAVSRATCYGPKDGAPPYAGTLIGDTSGYLWIGTSTALIRWKPGLSTTYELSGLRSNVALAGINALAAAPDGSVWAGISNSGRGLGLQRWVNGSWKALIAPKFDSSNLRVIGMYLDRHNALWIATYETGIYRIHDGNVDHFAGVDGLSSDTVESLFEDREGNLWVTTPGGVDCFRNIPVVSFSVHEGLGAGEVESIFAARDGTVWIGNRGGLDFVRRNNVSSIGPKQGFRGNRVTSLFEDHASRLWVGVDNGLLVYEHGRFTPLHRPDAGPFGIVLAMTEDIDHNVWASVIRNPPESPTRLICFRDGRFVKEISDPKLHVVSLAADPQSGLWLGLIEGGLARYRNDQVQFFPLKDASARVNQVLANSDGSVLAATDHGLVERRGDSQNTLDSSNGLPCNRIYALVTDKHSDLWLYAECGLIKIKSEDLQRWREHPEQKVNFDLFDAFDGAQPYLPPFRPIATRANDGRLWFANDTVAQMIDPEGQLRNPLPPPVHIEDVIANRKAYSPRTGLRLPALTRDLEIDYTAPSFVVPQKVHFQYKLEGYDRDWQDAGTRRQAFYGNLPPRNYTFRVKASNNSGLWNEAGASLDFVVAPAYYQTNWFRFSCVAVFIALVWVLHRWRVHRLKSQEKRLRDVVETIPAMTFTALSDGSSIFVNKRWTEYTGLSVEQSSGAGWQRAIHPEDIVRNSEKWRISVATGQPFEDEARFRRAPDGEYRWFLVRGVPLQQRHGKIDKWYGTLTDITDRKRAEEALQQSQMYLAEGQRLAHMGSWAFDPGGFFYYWSEELFQIYGLDPQKGPPTLEQYLSTLHPQDRDSMADTIKTMHKERIGCDVRKRIIRPDGEQRYVRCVGIPVVEGEVLKGFFGTAIDITDEELLRQELERQQAHLTEAQKLTRTGSWAWRAADRSAVHLSEEWYRIYGFDPAEGAPGWEEYFERIHPEDRLELNGIIERAIVEKAGYDHEFRTVLPNGKVKWIHTVAHPVLSDAGDLEQFVGSSTDVTELKSAEHEREQLRQLEADLAHTNRVSVLGEMAASLAHEIKQPIAAAMTSANSCIEWLAHEPPNLDRARAAAAKIDKYGNRAAEIIDHIRSLYRKSPPQGELIDVNEIVHEIFTLLQGEATRFSIEMRTELAPGLPKIMADRVQLQQVFMNLMLNAIEAMNESGGELTVKSQLRDGQVLLSVSDAGPGLPVGSGDQIFSAFFTTKPQGSGMGLAISRTIVESHGGRLWATANAGRGATFHFTLPTEAP